MVSCNYGCEYSPFAKRQQSAAELAKNEREVNRFTDWIAGKQEVHFSIFFTPWGEALIYPWYQQALVKLANLPNVNKVAIQTNLSCKLDWVEECDRSKLGLWATFPPEWVSIDI